MNLPFFTIGHSTRTLEDFVVLLRVAKVELVVDIRTVRRSRTNPQYNDDSITDNLAACGIGYEPMPELGGLRGSTKTVSPDVSRLWKNRSFHNHADHALSAVFCRGLARLTAGAHIQPSGAVIYPGR